MDMAQLSNTLLQIFYIMIGLYMGLTMVFTLKDKNHKTRIRNSTILGNTIGRIYVWRLYTKSNSWSTCNSYSSTFCN